MKKRVWADTNIILRVITGSPSHMAEEARRLVKRVDRGEVIFRLSPMVIAECCWVLQSYYNHSPDMISEVLVQFVNNQGVDAEQKEIIIEALQDYAEKNVDFIDAYIAAYARANPPDEVVTWNQKHFKRLGVTCLTPDEV